MSDNFLIGDLIRAKQSAVDATLSDIVPDALGPYFLQRRPALILGFYSEGTGCREFAWIAYKRKNGKWYEYGWPVTLSKYELVSRPEESSLLNPFKTWLVVPEKKHITLVRAKKCFYSFQWAHGTSTSDLNTPLMYQALPMSNTELGAYIRLALSKSSDHTAERAAGKFSKSYLDEFARQSAQNGKAVTEELCKKYKLEPTKLLSSRAKVHIHQLVDCYQLHPPVQYGGSDVFISIKESNEHLGIAVLQLLDRPYMAEKKYCQKYSYFSKVMPYLEQSIIDADF